MCGVNRSKRKYFDCSRDVTSGCSPVATKCIAVNGEIGARALHSVRLVPYILFKRMQTDGAVFTRSNGLYRRCENIRCTGGEPTENAWSHLRCLWEHSNKGSRSLLSSPTERPSEKGKLASRVWAGGKPTQGPVTSVLQAFPR